MNMKNVKIILFLTILATVWGCKKDDNDSGSDEPQWTNSTFTEAAKPTWNIDWSSNATPPDWKEPDAGKYECIMNILIELPPEAISHSTSDDRIAVFIGDECRGVSHPNKLLHGKVYFLMHVSGNSDEAGQPMELRYYCDGWHHMSVTKDIPPFVPNNIMDETCKIYLNIGKGSTKYPISTLLSALMPQKLPFTVSTNDMIAVFVGEECRGVGSMNPEYFDGWRIPVYSAQPEETAQIRYYSAEKGGIYTILKTFKLTEGIQQETISF